MDIDFVVNICVLVRGEWRIRTHTYATVSLLSLCR